MYGRGVVATAVIAPPIIGVVAASRLGLGVNPVETLLHWTGLTAIWLLAATLAVTPLRRWTAWNLSRSRRALGLATYAYAAAHFAVYAVFDAGLSAAYLSEDLAKRPYLALGMAAFVVLTALAATSSDRAIRALGRRWRSLHRSVWIAAGLALAHYWLRIRADYSGVATIGIVLMVLGMARWPRSSVRRPGSDP